MPAKKDQHQNSNRQRSRGQSLIEFALVLPFLLVLIISAIEIGRLFFTKIVITNAAREGAYYYAVNPSRLSDAGELTTRAQQAAVDEAANSGVTINEPIFTPSGSGRFSKIEATVSATVDDLLILSFVGNIFSISGSYQDITLSSTVEMMVQ